MHNLKEIRKDFSKFAKSLEKRPINIDFTNLQKLDELNRDLIQKKESLEKEKKEISKSKDESLFKKSKEISTELEKISESQKQTKIQLDGILSNIPNIPHSDVPNGKDENDNIEVLRSGKIPEFDFKPKSHYVLGENLEMLDFYLATKTTGSRFVFVKDKLALLERALSNFMLDIHVNQNDYQEISPPLIASDSTMFGTGQLPKFENDQFEIKFDEGSGRKFLIPTAEVILTNIVRDQIIDQKNLPMRFVASTPCFRKEAGSYGKDTQGMIRQHQFYKVEMVSIVEKENALMN
jgi:seryl-tRNA synthetase